MKKTGIKYFLRGLGVGIVLTALAFSIGYRVNAPKQNVVEQAKELGMVFPEGTAVPVAVTEQPVQETPAQETTAQETPAQTETATRRPKQSEKPQNTPKSEEDIKGTRFTVRGGLLSSSVAREMMEAGIIKSDKALDDYLEKSGYATEIRAGTYFIPKGAGYEEIARIITGRD